jgi:DNA-damage-inducible protein D
MEEGTHISPNFESIKQTNVYGVEYWSARDLAPLLGYTQWRRFEEAIQRAITACEQSRNIVVDHFASAGKMIETGKGAKRTVKNYNLSRLACYLIAQNGDPRKPEIAAAQLYFAIATRRDELSQLRQAQEERLEARLKVSESYKALAKAARGAGVNSERFGIFMDAGNLGLYHMTLQELKEKKGIPNDEEYLDRVGRHELSAIDFKNTLTEGKLLDEKVNAEDRAIDTHYFMGELVRKTIEEAKQPLPETLPTEPSIRKLVEERRRKQKRKNLSPPDEQERLF